MRKRAIAASTIGLVFAMAIAATGCRMGASTGNSLAAFNPDPASDRSIGMDRVPAGLNPTKDDKNGDALRRGQMLPITARAIVAGETIDLEVADSPLEQRLGLMFRQELPANRGMLFPLGRVRLARFWMKNVAIPLDMVFLREGEVRAIVPNVPPCQANPCPTYGPETPVDTVLELRGGRAAELGLQVGDRVEIQPLMEKPEKAIEPINFRIDRGGDRRPAQQLPTPPLRKAQPRSERG